MSDETLEIQIAQGVAIVWLAREKVRNAFNERSIAEITQAFTALGRDDEVRVVVLAARGPAFCAGADLEWMRKMAGYSHDENLADAGRLAAMLGAIANCPKPVVARVHGDAVAGGVGLVAACDIALASHDAAFCLSEVKLGLIPATIAPYVMRAIGARQAQRYFLSAEKFDSTEACRIGLIHETVPAGQLDARLNELLAALLQTSHEASAQAKRLVLDLADRPIDADLIADTVERIARVRASADGREGITAFLEKRKPRWVREFEDMQTAADDDEEM
ncbi:MAG: enoyl-CoA hydratase/isomerase family protein [Burkholderiaceae bacterium]